MVVSSRQGRVLRLSPPQQARPAHRPFGLSVWLSLYGGPRMVRKAVIPAAGLGTRFLPATKAQPKEMLPVVDKPAIQYVVEEAVRAGIRRHPDHHRPRQAVARGPLRPQLRARVLPREGRPPGRRGGHAGDRRAGRHPLRPPGRAARPRPRGRVARKHVGDEPFAVMLGDDIMDETLARARRA